MGSSPILKQLSGSRSGEPSVYVIHNNLSGKRYVGKTINVRTRWKSHRQDSRRAQPLSCIGRALKKYGLTNFTFTILEICETEEAAYDRERYWIAFYASDQKEFGYNLESGGHGGKVVSNDTRAKLSAASKGRPKPPHVIAALHSLESRAAAGRALRGRTHTTETRLKIAGAHQGRSKSAEAVRKSADGHRGRNLSSEHRLKLSQAGKGRPKTTEHREKIGASQRGQKRGPLSAEHREKVSLALKGRPHTPEHRAKLAAANRSRAEREMAAKVSGRTRVLLTPLG